MFPNNNNSRLDNYRTNLNGVITIDSDNERHSENESDIESDYDTDDESDIESDYGDIFHEEQIHIDMDKNDNKYYIGLAYYNHYRNIYLLSNSVTVSSFLKFPFYRILEYLYFYSISKPIFFKYEIGIEIMKTHYLEDSSLSVILKTHWLRIVQRNWKRIYKLRKEILKKRCSIYSLYQWQITGRYPEGLNSLPSLVGMLCNLPTCRKLINIKIDL
jgi:hypothetical protein